MEVIQYEKEFIYINSSFILAISVAVFFILSLTNKKCHVDMSRSESVKYFALKDLWKIILKQMKSYRRDSQFLVLHLLLLTT